MSIFEHSPNLDFCRFLMISGLLRHDFQTFRRAAKANINKWCEALSSFSPIQVALRAEIQSFNFLGVSEHKFLIF